MSGLGTDCCLTTKIDRIGVGIAACFSILGALVVITSFVKLRKMRRHPNSYLFCKTICDLGTVIMILLHLFKDERNRQEFCPAWLGMLTQFFALSSLIYYFGIPVDLMYGLNTPFSAPQIFRGWFQAFALVPSIATAIAIGCFKKSGSGVGICWICSSSSTYGNSTINGYRWGFYIGPSCAICIISIILMMMTWQRVFKGVVGTQKLREKVFLDSLLYTLCFTSYQLVVVIFLSIADSQHKSAHSTHCTTSNNTYANVTVILVTLHGMVDFLLWVLLNWKYLNWKAFTRCNKEESRERYDSRQDNAHQRYLKEIRRAVVIYTTRGIEWSVRKVAQEKKSDEHSNLVAHGSRAAAAGRSNSGSTGFNSLTKSRLTPFGSQAPQTSSSSVLLRPLDPEAETPVVMESAYHVREKYTRNYRMRSRSSFQDSSSQPSALRSARYSTTTSGVIDDWAVGLESKRSNNRQGVDVGSFRKEPHNMEFEMASMPISLHSQRFRDPSNLRSNRSSRAGSSGGASDDGEGAGAGAGEGEGGHHRSKLDNLANSNVSLAEMYSRVPPTKPTNFAFVPEIGSGDTTVSMTVLKATGGNGQSSSSRSKSRVKKPAVGGLDNLLDAPLLQDDDDETPRTSEQAAAARNSFGLESMAMYDGESGFYGVDETMRVEHNIQFDEISVPKSGNTSNGVSSREESITNSANSSDLHDPSEEKTDDDSTNVVMGSTSTNKSFINRMSRGMSINRDGDSTLSRAPLRSFFNKAPAAEPAHLIAGKYKTDKGFTIVFKDYEAETFWDIREMFHIDHEQYVKSISKTTKERFSEGASGAFMFFSQNERFIVKTTNKSEMDTLLRILKPYHDYIKRNPETLMCRYLGAYSIAMFQQQIYFVVMENVFQVPPQYAKTMDIYDLKGSWVNRSGKRVNELRGQKKTCKNCNTLFVVGKDKEMCPEMPNSPHIPRACMQDNDLRFRLRLTKEDAVMLASQLVRDSNFLCSQGLMDYSLLLGVIKQRVAHGTAGDSDRALPGFSKFSKQKGRDPKNRPFYQKQCGGMAAADVEGPGYYYMGIVDILQEWTLAKILEHYAKGFLRCMSRTGISAVPPKLYNGRFKTRVVEHIICKKEWLAEFQHSANLDMWGGWSDLNVDASYDNDFTRQTSRLDSVLEPPSDDNLPDDLESAKSSALSSSEAD